MNALWSLSARIGAQAFLALSSYLVSVSAAHSLSTDTLASFFVGWTLESMWIGAIRMVAVPALLLHEKVPRPVTLIGVTCLFGIPLAIAVFVAGSGLATSTQWLLAASVVTLGAYEIARSLVSRILTAALALPAADGAVFALALLGVILGSATHGDALASALASLSAAAVLVTAAGVVVLRKHQRDEREPERFYAWARGTWPLLRLGGLEWMVFFATSTGGLALLGLLGGPRLLAGVRLAETLVAPIGLVTSALPFIVASALRTVGQAERGWPVPVRHVWMLLTGGTILYLAAIQLAPEAVLSLVVGDHVDLAREASLGLALGVLASIFGATATLVMKHRREVKALSRLRGFELLVTLPAVAAGASTGSVVGAGLGVSGSQLFPALVQAFLLARGKRSHGS